MPKPSRGSRGGGRGRSRGGGRGGGRGIGPGGVRRGRSISSSRGGVGRRHDDSSYGKMRGRGGIARGRGTNIQRHDVEPGAFKESPETEHRQEENFADATKLGCQIKEAVVSPQEASKTALSEPSSKKGKKRGKGKLPIDESETLPKPIGQTSASSPTTAKLSRNSSTSPFPPKCTSPAPPQLRTQIQEQPPTDYASQDVRFKQKASPSTKLSSVKTLKNYGKNHNCKPNFETSVPAQVPAQVTATKKSDTTMSNSAQFVNADVQEQSMTNIKKSLMSNYTSQSTGLKVLSVTSSFPGYVFTANDRAKLVRSIPGVVIINTAMKGDCLILGVDIEEEKLFSLIPQVEKEKTWTISYVDTTDRDAFSYFAGWKLIPRVDKSGMFQLIVSLRSQGWRSRDAEMNKRNQLLDLVKDFNVAKVVHGEGETILLVGHVLECVAYSDCIRKVFTMERRHSWQPRPVGNHRSDDPIPGQERHFWVKMKCPELSNLSTAHKQYSVYHELSNAGKVLQLEHQLFGAVDNYLVVYSDIADSKSLGQQFCLLEIWPDSLPDFYTPTYGVDAWGFYSVSGRFPENLSNDTRNKFAEDMKLVGAVGFRSGESEDSFSLHFVNSRCLEQISRCAQYTSFRLTILSSLVRKPSLDKKLRRLVPAILKYKELKLAEKKYPQEMRKVEIEDSNSFKQVEKKFEPEANPEVKPEEKKSKKDENKNYKSKEVFEVKLDPSLKKAQQNSKVEAPKKEPVAGAKLAPDSVSTENIEEMANDKKSKITRKKNVTKNAKKNDAEVLDAVARSIPSTAEMDESTLFRICWKKEGSLSNYLNNLCKFFGMVKDVAVTEAKNSKEILFKFPSQKKLEEVLNLLSDETNGLDKLKMASPKVQLDGSKFFPNKFGLVMSEKSATISQLKKDFAKFGQVEIEVRSRVYVLWFPSKLGFFKAMTDRRTSGHKMVPSVQNFKFCNASEVSDHGQGLVATEVLEPGLIVVEDSMEKVEVVVETISEEEIKRKSQTFKLTEREIFGFIWQSPKGKIHIRDDQVISRQVTNFIKTVSCQEMTADEDGLIVSFSSQADLTSALSQFCSPPVPNTEQLSSIARKFTLLPSRGFFGLFSVKRVKPEHFSRFGDCKVRNCGIWFADKLSMFKVLRDPFISKAYPALFIDCRNIYILSSKKSLPPVKSTNHEKPAASSTLKPSYQFSPCQGVMTRSATAKLSVGDVATQSQVCKQDKKPAANSTVLSKCVSSEPTDTAIVTAVTLPSPDCQPSTPCSLLVTLLKTDKPQKTGLGQGKFGYMLGKFGHIPSARMVRTGYKQSKMPSIAREDYVADLFLEDKDCYRSKDVKEAANLISNILQGKMLEVTGATLREIKMKRVERFLKDKLGVECKLTEEGKRKLKDGGMVIDDNVDGKEDEFTKLIEPAFKIKSCNEDELKKSKEVNDYEKMNAIDAKDLGYSCPKIDDRKTRLLKKEAARRKFEKNALIFPEVLMHADNKNEELLPLHIENEDSVAVADTVQAHYDHVDSVADDTVVADTTVIATSVAVDIPTTVITVSAVDALALAKIVDKVPPQLTPDLIGLYTLTLPVSPGSDLTLLSFLQDDIAWFDTPVSILCIENMTEVDGAALIEVKMRDKDMALAVLNGLKYKYPGLEGDMTGSHADILPDKETGLYTLCFTDGKRKRYKATMEKFRMYSNQLPVISRGLGAEQVMVGFQAKKEAVEAFRENLDNEEFPELHIASVSRG